MAGEKKEKWQEQIEEMLKKQFSDNELDPVNKRASELIQMVSQVERPQDETWEAVKAIIHAAAYYMDSLTVAYIGFQLGAAYEKSQNARGT